MSSTLRRASKVTKQYPKFRKPIAPPAKMVPSKRRKLLEAGVNEDDAYWAACAQASEASGYLGSKKSMELLLRLKQRADE